MASELKTSVAAGSSAVTTKAARVGSVVHIASASDYKARMSAAGGDKLVVVDFFADW